MMAKKPREAISNSNLLFLISMIVSQPVHATHRSLGKVVGVETAMFQKLKKTIKNKSREFQARNCMFYAISVHPVAVYSIAVNSNTFYPDGLRLSNKMLVNVLCGC